MTYIWPMNSLATVVGLLTEEATSPLLMSFLSMPRTLKPMLSPGSAFSIRTWWVSMLLTSPLTLDGMNTIASPTVMTPVSTRPTGTVPTPFMVYTSWTGRRSGFFTGFVGTVKVSMAS